MPLGKKYHEVWKPQKESTKGTRITEQQLGVVLPDALNFWSHLSAKLRLWSKGGNCFKKERQQAQNGVTSIRPYH